MRRTLKSLDGERGTNVRHNTDKLACISTNKLPRPKSVLLGLPAIDWRKLVVERAYTHTDAHSAGTFWFCNLICRNWGMTWEHWSNHHFKASLANILSALRPHHSIVPLFPCRGPSAISRPLLRHCSILVIVRSESLGKQVPGASAPSSKTFTLAYRQLSTPCKIRKASFCRRGPCCNTLFSLHNSKAMACSRSSEIAPLWSADWSPFQHLPIAISYICMGNNVEVSVYVVPTLVPPCLCLHAFQKSLRSNAIYVHLPQPFTITRAWHSFPFNADFQSRVRYVGRKVQASAASAGAGWLREWLQYLTHQRGIRTHGIYTYCIQGICQACVFKFADFSRFSLMFLVKIPWPVHNNTEWHRRCMVISLCKLTQVYRGQFFWLCFLPAS